MIIFKIDEINSKIALFGFFGFLTEKFSYFQPRKCIKYKAET